MKRLLLLLTITLCASPAAGQTGDAQANSALGAVRPLYATAQRYLLAAAEQMPEADYGFRPTEEVRSFGQLIGHVANAQYLICSGALGEANPATGNYEEVTEKAALVEALRGSNELCDRAYQQGDEAVTGTMQLFGQERTKLYALSLNAVHDWEHYGNIVTYLRIKGMVPPSSQRN